MEKSLQGKGAQAPTTSLTIPAFYNSIMAPKNISFPKHLNPVATALADERIAKLMLIVSPGSGKALKPDTKIPTPNGFKALKNLKVGDSVISPNGNSTKILGIRHNSSSDLYKFTFKDGRELTANKDHLWKCYTKKFNKTELLDTSAPDWRIRSTEELVHYFANPKNNKWYVPLAEPVEYAQKVYDIAPYTLGVLIGDGSITGHPGFTSFDQEIVDRVSNEWGAENIVLSKSDPAKHYYGVKGIKQALIALNLHGKLSYEKHIPEEYKYGSIEQRISLIQGLMDTDGTVNNKLGTPSFCTTSRTLAEDVREILWSLGCIVHIGQKKGRYTREGKYVNTRIAYNLSIRSKNPEMLFHLSRKKFLARKTQYTEGLALEIKSIIPDIRSESICIMVENSDGLFLAGDYVTTHNSMFLSVVYPLYVLGMKPDHTIINVSASEGLPQGFMQAVMEVIDKSPHYKRLFPKTRPDKKAGWSMERGIYTTARPPGDPDSSYRAAGLTSKQLVGKHAKLMILDDIHDQENSSSMGACQKVIDSYYNNLLGRADPQESRFVLAGRRWSQWDIYGHLMESGDWVALKLPAERGPGQTALYYDVYVPPGMECCFTEGGAMEVPSDNPAYRMFRAYYGVDPLKQGFYWPEMEVKRRDYFTVKRNNPASAAAVYQASPGGRESGVFLESDFKYLPLGNYPRLTPSLIPPSLTPPGSRIIQSWDVSHTVGKNADYSVCMTAILIPCSAWHNGEQEELIGKADAHYDVVVVDLWVGQVEASGLMDKMRELDSEWNPEFIAVEKNTGSIPIIQMLSNSLPIIPMALKNNNKKARALISVGPGTASVQGWMRQGRVRFWEEAPWLRDLKTEMIDFTGDGAGHDDRVDAATWLITQAILLGSGTPLIPSDSSTESKPIEDSQLALEAMAMRSDAGRLLADLAQAHQASQTRPAQVGIQPIMPTNLPAIQVCQNCRYRDKMSMCIIQRRRVVGLDSCASWSWDGQNGQG